MLFLAQWGGVDRFCGALSKPPKGMFIVQVETIEEVSLIRVLIEVFILFIGFKSTSKVIQALQTLVNHHLFTEQIQRQQVHRQVGLFNQPIVNVPLWIDAEHGVGELAHFGRHVIERDTAFLLVFVLVSHGYSSHMTAYEASPPHNLKTVHFH
jgi:hypothetical protein